MAALTRMQIHGTVMGSSVGVARGKGTSGHGGVHHEIANISNSICLEAVAVRPTSGIYFFPTFGVKSCEGSGARFIRPALFHCSVFKCAKRGPWLHSKFCTPILGATSGSNNGKWRGPLPILEDVGHMPRKEINIVNPARLQWCRALFPNTALAMVQRAGAPM